MKNLIWTILLVCFALDIVRKNFLEPNQPKKEVKESSTLNINDNTAAPVNSYSLLENENEKENGKEISIESSIKTIEENENNSDSLDKVRVNIKYCTVSYSNQFQEMKNELTKAGNFSLIEVLGEEFPLNPIKKLLSKIFSYLQFFIMAIMIGGQWIKPYLTFIPDSVFKFIEEKRMIIGLVNFFVMSKISSTLGSSNAFEVYANSEMVNEY